MGEVVDPEVVGDILDNLEVAIDILVEEGINPEEVDMCLVGIVDLGEEDKYQGDMFQVEGGSIQVVVLLE